MRHLIVFLLMGLSTVSARAADDSVCENLYAVTCKPTDHFGTYDGTGSARTQDTKKAIVAQVGLRTGQKIKALLKDPQHAAFLQKSVAALGAPANSACAANAGQVSSECLKLLSQVNMRILLGAPKSDRSNSSAQDLDALKNSPELSVLTASFVNDLRKSTHTDELDKKIRYKIFPKIKELLIAKINSMVQDPEVKEAMLKKVRIIEFDGSDCFQDSDKPPVDLFGLFYANAQYKKEKNLFFYCSALALNNTSEFTIASVIAHELSHSIDPCNILKGPSNEVIPSWPVKSSLASSREEAEASFPIPGVLSCLASESSAHAVSLFPGPLEKYKGGPNDFVTTIPALCRDDQLEETFPDWMSAEILPDYIQENLPNLTIEQRRAGYANVWSRGPCHSPDSGFDIHLTDERRANFILMVQPKVRQQMGCSERAAGHIYCPAGGNQATGSASDSKRGQD